MEKSVNNQKVSGFCNCSSSEDTAKQNVRSLDDSSETNFLNPLTSVNNIYNIDACSWPKNTILISEL